MRIKINCTSGISYPDDEKFFINRRMEDNYIFADYIGKKTLVELGEKVEEIDEFSKEITALRKQISKLFERKNIEAKKVLIDKPWLTDKELEVQLEVYQEKYNDAKEGLDVFKTQALILGKTQEEYRQLIIEKGDYLIFAKKNTVDLIESVRQLLETFVAAIKTEDDIARVKEKLQLVDEFHLGDDVEEFIQKLKENM